MEGTKRQHIVGIVGKTLPANDAVAPAMQIVLDRARELGAAVSRRKWIVLTGGHHACVEHSVKYQAILGALEADHAACIIGVVPNHLSTKALASKTLASYTNSSDQQPLIETQLSLTKRCLYLHTALPSDGRNPITGSTVDVMVALYGFRGTVAEVCWAHHCNNNLIFLDSCADLLQAFQQGQPILDQHGQALGFPPADPQLQVGTIAGVITAIDIVLGSGLPVRKGWPIPNAPQPAYVKLRDDFESALPQLCR